jgi:hypothetical protein
MIPLSLPPLPDLALSDDLSGHERVVVTLRARIDHLRRSIERDEEDIARDLVGVDRRRLIIARQKDELDALRRAAAWLAEETA